MVLSFHSRLFSRVAVSIVVAAAVTGAAFCPNAARSEPAVAEKPAAASADKPARKKNAPMIAHVSLAGAIPDGVGQGGLLADVSPHLHRIVERLDKAAKDARVKAVLLSIESPALGRARADELRAAIGRVRRAGKPVAARGDARDHRRPHGGDVLQGDARQAGS